MTERTEGALSFNAGRFARIGAALLTVMFEEFKGTDALVGNRGCFVVVRTREGIPLASSLFGHLDRVELWSACAFADEQASRLRGNNAKLRHTTSRQSAMPGLKLLAGAVVAGDHIVSTAGFHQFASEFFSIALAYWMGFCNIDEAKTLAVGNPFEPQLVPLLERIDPRISSGIACKNTV